MQAMRKPPSRKRRSLGKDQAVVMHRALLLEALQLVVYLARFETLIPMPLDEDIPEPDPTDEIEVAWAKYLGRRVWRIFGGRYWMRIEQEDAFGSWQEAYDRYVGIAAKVRSLPARCREELLDLLIREVESQPSSSTDGTDGDSPLVRMNDLTEPLGYALADVLDRRHLLHMRSLEHDIDDEDDWELELKLGLCEEEEE